MLRVYRQARQVNSSIEAVLRGERRLDFLSRSCPIAVFTSARREQVRAMLHQSPRTFDKPTSLWTLDLAADVAYALGITPRRVSGETMRHALAALQTRWKRANPWLPSPDPASARGKPSATG